MAVKLLKKLQMAQKNPIAFAIGFFIKKEIIV